MTRCARSRLHPAWTKSGRPTHGKALDPVQAVADIGLLLTVVDVELNAIAGGQAVAHHAGVLAIRNQNASPEPRQSGATLELAGLQQALEFLEGLFLGDSVYQRDFSAEAIERRHVQLSFAETLAGVARSEKIASDLRDRNDISGFVFAFVFLSKPGPVAAAFPGGFGQNLFLFLDRRKIRRLAHSDVRGFPDGNA